MAALQQPCQLFFPTIAMFLDGRVPRLKREHCSQLWPADAKEVAQAVVLACASWLFSAPGPIDL